MFDQFNIQHTIKYINKEQYYVEMYYDKHFIHY